MTLKAEDKVVSALASSLRDTHTRVTYTQRENLTKEQRASLCHHVTECAVFQGQDKIPLPPEAAERFVKSRYDTYSKVQILS